MSYDVIANCLVGPATVLYAFYNMMFGRPRFYLKDMLRQKRESISRMRSYTEMAWFEHVVRFCIHPVMF